MSRWDWSRWPWAKDTPPAPSVRLEFLPGPVLDLLAVRLEASEHYLHQAQAWASGEREDPPPLPGPDSWADVERNHVPGGLPE